jgi:hypothetical protein
MQMIPGTTADDNNSSVTVRKEIDGQGEPQYYFDVLFQRGVGSILLFSSKNNAVLTLGFDLTRQFSPNHSIVDSMLHIVFCEMNTIPPLASGIGYVPIDAMTNRYTKQPESVFRVKNSQTVLRDPRIHSFADQGQEYHLVVWTVGFGDNLFFSDNYDDPDDWFQARSSSLAHTSLTSYPLVFAGSDQTSLIGTTRTETTFGWPHSLLQFRTKSRAQDLVDGATLQELVTGKIVRLENGERHQEFCLAEPTVHDGIGTQIGSLRYAFNIPSVYWGGAGGTPVDTLTTTESTLLVDDENLRFSIQVRADSIITDTTVVYGYLVDQVTDSVLSTSGEYRIPPAMLDTTIVLGLELPSGVNMATVRIHTGISRGLLQGGDYEMTLVCEHIYSDPASPKTIAGRESGTLIRPDQLHIYPTEVSPSTRLTVQAPFDGALLLRIHSLLGRERYRMAVPVSVKGMLHAIEVPQLKYGMYVISVVGSEGMRSGRILVR